MPVTCCASELVTSTGSGQCKCSAWSDKPASPNKRCTHCHAPGAAGAPVQAVNQDLHGVNCRSHSFPDEQSRVQLTPTNGAQHFSSPYVSIWLVSQAGGALAGTQHPLCPSYLCSSSLPTRWRLPRGAPTGAARRCLLLTGTGLGPHNAARPAQHRHRSAAGRLCMMQFQQLWEDWHCLVL